MEEKNKKKKIDKVEDESKTPKGSILFIVFSLVAVTVGIILYSGFMDGVSSLLTSKTKNTANEITRKEIYVHNKCNVKTKAEEMTVELAYGILNKYRAEKLPDVDWYIGKVKLKAHGDNDVYWVIYEEISDDGISELGVFIEKKDGKWITRLPGSFGYVDGDFDKYNFVDY